MIFRDLSQDISRLVKDMRNQETSEVRRVEEKTVETQDDGPEIRTEYTMSMRTLPSKEELKAYQNEVQERNGSMNDLMEPRDQPNREEKDEP